jgi:hypothetical protein
LIGVKRPRAAAADTPGNADFEELSMTRQFGIRLAAFALVLVCATAALVAAGLQEAPASAASSTTTAR